MTLRTSESHGRAIYMLREPPFPSCFCSSGVERRFHKAQVKGSIPFRSTFFHSRHPILVRSFGWEARIDVRILFSELVRSMRLSFVIRDTNSPCGSCSNARHGHEKRSLRRVGFEPTSTNTLRPEHNPLDRSGICASGVMRKFCIHRSACLVRISIAPELSEVGIVFHF